MAPIFSKLLAKTDVKNSLSWPIEHLHLLMQIPGPPKVPFLVEDDFGNRWEFICSMRDGDHLKPVIIGQWRTFVRAKGLRVGDELTFYEHEDPAVQFLIQVQRPKDPPLRLGGGNIEKYPVHGQE